MFAFLKRKTDDHSKAEKLYNALVDKSRNQSFYTDLGIPDTVDGRFDLIVSHVVLVMMRLDELKAYEFNQKLFDVMFLDMDRACREMGIGDLSVPKQIKKMMLALNGRLQVYKQSLDSNDPESLEQSLQKNIFGDATNSDHACIKHIASYLKSNYDMLNTKTVDEIKDFNVDWVTI